MEFHRGCDPILASWSREGGGPPRRETMLNQPTKMRRNTRISPTNLGIRRPRIQ